MQDKLTRIDSLYKKRVTKIKKLIEVLNEFVDNPEHQYSTALYSVARPLTPAMLTAKLSIGSDRDDDKDPAQHCLVGLKDNPDLTEQYMCPDCFEKNAKNVKRLLLKIEKEIESWS